MLGKWCRFGISALRDYCWLARHKSGLRQQQQYCRIWKSYGNRGRFIDNDQIIVNMDNLDLLRWDRDFMSEKDKKRNWYLGVQSTIFIENNFCLFFKYFSWFLFRHKIMCMSFPDFTSSIEIGVLHAQHFCTMIQNQENYAPKRQRFLWCFFFVLRLFEPRSLCLRKTWTILTLPCLY